MYNKAKLFGDIIIWGLVLETVMEWHNLSNLWADKWQWYFRYKKSLSYFKWNQNGVVVFLWDYVGKPVSESTKLVFRFVSNDTRQTKLWSKVCIVRMAMNIIIIHWIFMIQYQLDNDGIANIVAHYTACYIQFQLLACNECINFFTPM